MATISTQFQNIQRAISAYADQAYTDEVRIAGTALIGSDARISTSDEDFYGTIRWDRTLGALNYGATQTATDTHINHATETNAEGLITEMATDFAEYIKSYRTMGATQFNVTQVITGRDGAIGKIARDFAVTRARDNDAAIVSVLKGVIKAEALMGDHGQIDPDALDEVSGFYVDVNNKSGADDGGTAGTAKLITAGTGGAAAENLWEAISCAYSDAEPDFVYLVVQPSVYNDMRSANLLENQDRITDGNVVFDTLLQGKVRLLVSRTSFGDYGTGTDFANINTGSTKTSLVMLPGAISQSDLAVVNPVEFDRDASQGTGAGQTEAWYRWGYVYHPRGYTIGAGIVKTAFATNATYETNTSWARKEKVGNLGILPIFHS